MIPQNDSPLGLRQKLEKDHPLASDTFISSPCSKFKIKCRIMDISYWDYEMSILYHNQTMGERYDVGQEITFYHEKEKWTKQIRVVSRKGNTIEAEVVEPITMIENIADDGTKTAHVCELLGQYSNLYRVSFNEPELLDGSVVLHLPNGENYPVRLRWKDGNELCFQIMGPTKR